MSEEAVEQITKVPTELQGQPPQKEKHPKKVAAGKKLAAYNKEAKEALDRERKREAENKSEVGKVNTTRGGEGTSESLSEKNEGWQTTAIGVLVVGLTAANLLLRYWDMHKSGVSPASYSQSAPPQNTPEPSYATLTQPSKIPVPTPKVGLQLKQFKRITFFTYKDNVGE